MRLSIDWLREFVEIPEGTAELGELLTMLGLESEEILEPSSLKNVVAGKVLTVAEHPRADNLKVCTVNDGDQTLAVVCGAPNLAVGQIVPLARVGARLPGDIEVRKSRLRGVESQGLICAPDELGLGADHSGIMVLPDTLEPGFPLGDYFREQYPVLELDLTPNRPDCLSHLGVAREIAVKTGRTLRPPSIRARTRKVNKLKDKLSIRIEDPQGCPRYVAGIVENIQVGPSPEWMVRRLEAAGQRSINNIVDISNYVLLEMGHPTHLFDLDKLAGREVTIRRAQGGEQIITLDDGKFTLQERHLVISDENGPVALAGIIGGRDSAVSETTTRVLIESAYFDPVTIRRGAKSLGLITEASRRFERGADPEGAWAAFWRVVDLLESLAQGQAVEGVRDEYPRPIYPPNIKLRRAEIDLLSGCEIDSTFIETTLTGLNITWERIPETGWNCIPPSFRPDLEREADLIEEIVRFYGYDRVPTNSSYQSLFSAENPDPQSGVNQLLNQLVGLGFRQCYNNSLQSREEAASGGLEPVGVLNPLSKTMSHLRTSLFPGLLQNIDYNLKNAQSNLRLAEVGQVFIQTAPGKEGIREKALLTGTIQGDLVTPSVHEDRVRKTSFFVIKGMVRTLLEGVGIGPLRFAALASPELDPALAIQVDDTLLGQVGALSPDYLQALDLETGPVYGFQLELDPVLDLLDREMVYQPVVTYPKVERDLNLVFDERLPVGEVVRHIQTIGQPLLCAVEPVNIYRHPDLGQNMQSVTFRLVFQSPSKTLEERDVTTVINEIIDIVSSSTGAKLRSQ